MILTTCPVPIYGDTTFRGKCPKEDVEQASFFNRLRGEYPDSHGLLALHPRNEGLLSGGQFHAIRKHRAEGMSPGASDIVIPGCPSFVCEMKRQNHMLSKWEAGQQAYLKAASDAGAFACVALGAVSAWEAFEAWLRVTDIWRGKNG
jgi:hypothetical protein